MNMATLESICMEHVAANDPLGAGSSVHAAPLDQPLVLDLDHALLRPDQPVAGFLAALRRNPINLFAAIVQLAQGKVRLQPKLAAFTPGDWEAMPVHEGLVELAKREAGRGRRVVLATACDELMAHRFAKRFAFMDAVLASNGSETLEGAARARRLAALFPQGFLYAGSRGADLDVWQQAQSTVGVNLKPKTAKALARLAKPMLLLQDPRRPAPRMR
jgi:hypothetical protein